MSDSGSEAGNYKVNQLGCVREESGTEKMGKSDLVRAIPDTVIKEKALIIYPDFSEGAIDKPQRMGEWSASQKDASWVWGANTTSWQGLKDAEALRWGPAAGGHALGTQHHPASDWQLLPRTSNRTTLLVTGQSGIVRLLMCWNLKCTTQWRSIT